MVAGNSAYTKAAFFTASGNSLAIWYADEIASWSPGFGIGCCMPEPLANAVPTAKPGIVESLHPMRVCLLVRVEHEALTDEHEDLVVARLGHHLA